MSPSWKFSSSHHTDMWSCLVCVYDICSTAFCRGKGLILFSLFEGMSWTKNCRSCQVQLGYADRKQPSPVKVTNQLIRISNGTKNFTDIFEGVQLLSTGERAALTKCAHGAGEDWGFSGLSHVLYGPYQVYVSYGLQGYDHSTGLFCCLTVKDGSVTRWRWTNYVMGTQPVRRAINLGKAEMTGGPCLFTVTGTVTLGFHASLTPSRRVLFFFFRPLFPYGSKL